MATFKKSFMLLILFPTFLFAEDSGALFVNEVTLNLEGAKEVARRVEVASKKLNKTVSLA